MSTVPAVPPCGHAVPREDCLSCVEAAMLFDEAQKESAVKSAAMAGSSLPSDPLQEILSILREHVGETGKSESAVEVVRRLSNFWKQWGEIARQIRKLNELLGPAGDVK